MYPVAPVLPTFALCRQQTTQQFRVLVASDKGPDRKSQVLCGPDLRQGPLSIAAELSLATAMGNVDVKVWTTGGCSYSPSLSWSDSSKRTMPI